MDPLSDVLSLLKPRAYFTAALDAGGEWSIRFPRHEGIKFQVVVSGAAWLAVEGVADAVRLQAGDCFLLTRGWPFRTASDLSLTPVDGHAVFPFPPALDGRAVSYNGGGDYFAVGSLFLLTGKHAGVLLEALPPIVHIRGESDRAALRWSLDRMTQELRERQPGSFLIAEHLAHMILLQALRLHLAEGMKDGVGWLCALADRQMGAAIGAIHDDPAHRWTLQELARRAGMSRSTFALKFKEKVGASPMEYLTRWRMLLAGDRLANSSDPVSTIALALGYESESSFSTAFKRVMGCSPRQYSRSEKAASLEQGQWEAARIDRPEPVAD